MKSITRIIVLTLVTTLLFGIMNTFAADEGADSGNEVIKNQAEIEEDIVLSAIETLKNFWKNEVYNCDMGDKGTYYLGIRYTRILWVKDDFGLFEYEGQQETAEEMFSDVNCIVNFMILSDFSGTGGPLYLEHGVYENVIAYDDGTMEVVCYDPLKEFSSRTFCMDFNKIIDSVSEFNADYNADYYLK